MKNRKKIVTFVGILSLICFGNSLSQGSNIDYAFDCLKNNRYSEAISRFTDLIGLNDTISTFYYGRGTAYLYTGDNINAVKDLEKTININTNSIDAYYGLAIAHINLENYQASISIINKAIKIDTTYYELYYARGIVNYINKNYQNAVKDFNYVLEHRNSLNALYGRAISFYKQKLFSDTSTDLAAFLQNNKTNNALVDECHRLLDIIRNN